MLNVLAILCVRNEALHVRACIEDLLDDGISVHVIDHSSTDETASIVGEYLGHGVECIDSMPWEGAFSLSEQMRAKSTVAAAAKHDWILHIDADEALSSPVEGQTLLDAIQAVDQAGHNCINFDEFVFVPRPGSSFENTNYRSLMAQYYFFEPSKRRLMRAFKRSPEIRAWEDGGHRVLGGGLSLHPTDFILRHYIALSADDFARKYAKRVFSNEDLDKGWHKNRLLIDTSLLPDPRKHRWLKTLHSVTSRSFDRTDPAETHFWEWEHAAPGKS